MPTDLVNNSHSLVFGTKQCFVSHCKLIEWRNMRPARGESGTRRRHWGRIESTGPWRKKNETGYRAVPQLSHAPFAQVSRLPMPLRRLENLILTDDMHNFEMQST